MKGIYCLNCMGASPVFWEQDLSLPVLKPGTPRDIILRDAALIYIAHVMHI